MATDKSLGQHWLTDRAILAEIADMADIEPTDTVLEIGPGLGTLTSELLRRAREVVAVEFDEQLAAKLPGQFPGTALSVHHGDILSFDLDSLPPNYVVVANIPYYITSKIVERLLNANNKPRRTVLLVQQEVAERLAAEPGSMSLLAISAQIFAETRLGPRVARQYFTPPPRVDSQVIILETRNKPLIPPEKQPAFFRVARAGFGAKRKKLRSSISAGLAIDKPATEDLLLSVGINPDDRAQDLSIDDWRRLAEARR